MSKSPFGTGLVKFLRDLEDNNNRPWFEENKDRYESQVREPALAFIRAMEPQVRKVSPHLAAIDRKVGGSLMRIHRDVRFSKDKAPYKTNLGIQFRHESGKDVHAPGLYFHVDDQGVFLAVGMWHPDRETLTSVREAIAENSKGWKRVRDGKRFRETWNLEGESLRSAPRGYPKDHPLIDDLRRTDHIAVCKMKKTDLTRGDLVREIGDRYRLAKSYLGWIAKALDLPF